LVIASSRSSIRSPRPLAGRRNSPRPF
jgi:hypothetical protein